MGCSSGSDQKGCVLGEDGGRTRRNGCQSGWVHTERMREKGGRGGDVAWMDE